MSEARPSWQRIMLNVLTAILIADVAVLGLLGIVAIVLGDGWFLNEPFVSALFAIAVYDAIALAAAAVMRRGCAVRGMVAAMVMAAAALCLTVRLIIDDDFFWLYEEIVTPWISVLTVAAVLLVYDAGILRYRFKLSPGRWIQGAVRIAAWTFWSVIALLVAAGPSLGGTTLNLFVVAIPPLLVTTGLSTLLGPLVVRSMHQRELRRFAKDDASLPRDFIVSMVCPRCEADIAAKRGPGRCDACGFTMHIEIEEPRCECGYLIYEHTSAICPECGREIPESDRWREAMNA